MRPRTALTGWLAIVLACWLAVVAGWLVGRSDALARAAAWVERQTDLRAVTGRQ